MSGDYERMDSDRKLGSYQEKNPREDKGNRDQKEN
jgi:hypothetical protein